ncbi:MAG: glycoside hydrolase family 73 protein [Aureispira sp.]
MWKLLIAALFCYGVFLYYQRPPAPVVLNDHKGWMETQTPDSILIYINQHRHLAIQEMQRAKVPASITLSQAILESRFGTSLLAQHANNHFGIKANPHWDGNDRHCAYTHEWSKQKEGMYPAFACFRRYANTAEGYAGHSDFLTNRPRYAPLFQLAITDWKGWAKGLQKAGYATDPTYASKLIALVERYHLQQFDLVPAPNSTPVILQQHSTKAASLSNTLPLPSQ